MSSQSYPRKWLLCLVVFLCVTLALVVSCDTAGKACATDLVCASGQICLKEACTIGCRTSFACPVGTFCLENRCGADACTPGKSRACYSGKEGTLGIGTCRAGLQFCDDKGRWSLCSGELTPQTESCDREDNDCNGLIDDGISCECTSGTERVCYTGPKGTIADGRPCQAGVQTCLQDKLWGKCRDQRLPLPEVCGMTDNDCDGSPDNGLVCGCQSGETRPCYDGPVNTVGSGICKVGTQSCEGSKWGACIGAVKPAEREICNNLDDDCNGLIDDLAWGKGCGGETPLGPEVAFDASEPVVPEAPADVSPELVAIPEAAFPDVQNLPDVSPPYQVYGTATFRTNAQGHVWTHDMVTDAAGAVFLVGYYQDTDFVFSTEVTEGKTKGIFVAGFTPGIALSWLLTVGGSGDSEGLSIARGAQNTLYITGVCSDKIFFGPNQQKSRDCKKGSFFVAKLTTSAASATIDALIIPTTNTQSSKGTDVAVMGQNVYVLGEFSGTIGPVGTTRKPSVGGVDIFVAKLPLALNTMELFTGGGISDDRAGGLVTAPTTGAGALFVLSSITSNANFDSKQVTIPPGANAVSVLLHFAPNQGKFIKSFHFVCRGSCIGNELAIDGQMLYVVGTLAGAIQDESGAFLPLTGRKEMFVGWVDTSLRLVRVRRTLTPKGKGTEGVGVSAMAGGVFVAGNFDDSFTFGGIPGTATPGQTSFVATLDASGNVTWLIESKASLSTSKAQVTATLTTNKELFAVGVMSGQVRLFNIHSIHRAAGLSSPFILRFRQP